MSGTRSNKLWIFTELFYPDETSTGYILTEISKGLLSHYNISVITSAALYNSIHKDSQVTDGLEGMEIIRVRGVSFNKDRILTRIVRLLTLSIQFCYYFATKVKKGERVLLVTNPALVLLGISLINYFKRAKTFLIVHDVFPENALTAKLIRDGIFYKFVKFIFSSAYSSFDHLLVIGRDMKMVIEKKIARFSPKPLVTVVENWAETDQLFIKNSTKYNIFNDDRIHFVFAGNIGRVQGLKEILDVLGNHADKLTLTFIGNGALKKELVDIASQRKYDNINFIDSLPRSEQNEFINSFDISLVSLSLEMFGLGVPSKVYNIFSCGKPVCFVGPLNSEIDLMVKEFNLGWSVSSYEDLNNLCGSLSKENIKQLNRENIRQTAILRYSKSIVLGKIITILE